MRVTVVQLRELLASDEWSNTQVRKTLSAFRCERNEDVTTFLKQYAINNERNGASRTFLAFNDDLLANHQLELVAFYTIALTSVDYSGIGTVYRRQIMGNVPGYRTSTTFPSYLIAQLARDDRYGAEVVSGSALLQQAESLVYDASKTIGGRILYVDCKDALVWYYEKLGYTQLFFDEETSLHKMFKSLGLLD